MPFQIPNWLDVSPSDYLRATQSGAQMGHAIAESTQRAWEEQARMQMAAQQQEARMQQLAVENEQQRLAADRLEAYRQQEMKNAQDRLKSIDVAQQRADELTRHNMAMEEARLTGRPEASIVNLPDAPGFSFLKNPSGALTPLVRPIRAQSELERARLELSALNAMAPKGGEDPSSADYQSRTNAVGQIMQALKGPTLEVAPSDKRLRKTGTAYKTSKGVFKWTGTGWVPLTNSPQPMLSSPTYEESDDGE